jgi:hypothetical protein
VIILEKIYPVIMDSNFQRLAVIDDYTSFIWTSRYYSAGDFELCVDATAENMSLFAVDYFVVRDDDDNVGLIEDIQIQRNEDGHEIMIVTGRFLVCLLGRRIIAKQTTVTGKVSACINQLVTDNIINPSISARQITNFTIDRTYTSNSSMQAQYTGKNLLETISEICETYGIGFKVTFDENNNFVFALYEGIDRTYDQNENTWVIFSDQYDNLISSNYEENYRDIITAVLVAGEGEGLDRKTLWVTDGSTGLDRHELYKDQRNLQSNDGEISDAEYQNILKESGEESLTTYTTAFTGSVYFDNIKYREDVNLGDLCVIENSRWGIYINTRLVEVIESVNEAGAYSIVPTFGLVSSHEPSDDSYLLTETNDVILSEDNIPLVNENTLRSASSSDQSGDSKRISDLNELSTLDDDLFIPFADSNVETHKVRYSTIKADMAIQAISNEEIDRLLV